MTQSPSDGSVFRQLTRQMNQTCTTLNSKTGPVWLQKRLLSRTSIISKIEGTFPSLHTKTLKDKKPMPDAALPLFSIYTNRHDIFYSPIRISRSPTSLRSLSTFSPPIFCQLLGFLITTLWGLCILSVVNNIGGCSRATCVILFLLDLHVQK